MISCVLLSAGSSVRFGSPKALAKIDIQTVIEHIQTALINSKVNEIIIVLGDHAEKIESFLLNHAKVKSVYNKDYRLGQTSSFKAGLKVVSPGVQGVMLFPVDVPFVKPQTIDALLKEFLVKKPSILIPTFGNKKGHPPIFHFQLIKDLLRMDDSLGLNAFQAQHQAQTLLFPVSDNGILLSFNTPEEFEKIKSEADLRII